MATSIPASPTPSGSGRVEQSFLQHLDGQHNRDQLARLARVPIQRINEQIERFARLGLLIPTPN
jgi:hypothetical protein